MPRLGPLERAEIVSLHQAGASERDILARMAGRVGNLGTIYRVLRETHLAAGAGRPSPLRGRRPALDAIPAEVLPLLMAAIYRDNRTPEQALTDLEANGKLLAGAVHPGTVNRWLRADMNLTRREAGKTGRKVTQRFERHFANELHQVDATRAAIYHMDTRGQITYEPDSAAMRRAEAEGKTPVNVFGLIDDHSRACYLRAADRESIANWFEFLHRAWSIKEDPAVFPLAGMPETVYADNTTTLFANQVGRRLFSHCGTAAPGCVPQITAKGGRATVTAEGGRATSHAGLLGVRLITHKPHQPWSKGKIERLLQSVQTEETGLRRAAYDGLDDFNDWLGKVNLFICNRVHSSTGEAPFARWTRSMAAGTAAGGQPLRLPPPMDLWQRWIMRDAECTIDKHLRVRFDGEAVQLPHTPAFTRLAGKRVVVLFRPACDDDLILIHDGAELAAPRTAEKLHAWLNPGVDLRTAGEIVRDGTRDVDLSGIDTTLRLAANVRRDWQPPTAAVPFHVAQPPSAVTGLESRPGAAVPHQAAVAAAIRTEPLSRLQAIARLREARIVGGAAGDLPLTADDAALVDGICPVGGSIERQALEGRIADLLARSRQQTA